MGALLVCGALVNYVYGVAARACMAANSCRLDLIFRALCSAEGYS